MNGSQAWPTCEARQRHHISPRGSQSCCALDVVAARQHISTRTRFFVHSSRASLPREPNVFALVIRCAFSPSTDSISWRLGVLAARISLFSMMITRPICCMIRPWDGCMGDSILFLVRCHPVPFGFKPLDHLMVDQNLAIASCFRAHRPWEPALALFGHDQVLRCLAMRLPLEEEPFS